MKHPSNDPLPPNSPARMAARAGTPAEAHDAVVPAAAGGAPMHHAHAGGALIHQGPTSHAIGHGVDQHGHPTFHPEHPTAGTYFKVGAILTIITIIEVWVYYIPGFTKTKIFVPLLLAMSAAKFAIVVMFYMHLKYDHKLFRSLFVGPLLIAAGTLMGLLFLFGKLAVRLGLLT